MNRNRQPCLILALESAVGSGRNMEIYYKCLLRTNEIFPIMVYTDTYAYTHAPKWIRHKIVYSIPKTTHNPEDCDDSFCALPLNKHRPRTLWNKDCIKLIVYLRSILGEKAIWVVDSTNHEIEQYMGRYIVQVFHTELFNVFSYFKKRSAQYFRNYWLILIPSQLLKNLVLKYCKISPQDSRLHVIGRVLDDSLYDGLLRKQKILRTYHLNEKHKTILYAPTWESKKIWAIGRKESDMKNLQRLYAFARLNNLNVILRPHPISINHFNVKKGYIDSIKNVQNVYFDDTTHSNIYGPNKSLLAADILVTDLSSIATDFLSLGKPVVFIYPQKEAGLWNNMPSYATVNRVSYTVRSFSQLFQTLDRLLHSKESGKRIYKRTKFVSWALAPTGGKSGLLFAKILRTQTRQIRPVDFLNVRYIYHYIYFLYKRTFLTKNNGLHSLISSYSFSYKNSDNQ